MLFEVFCVNYAESENLEEIEKKKERRIKNAKGI